MNLNNLTLEAIEELENDRGKKYSSFKSIINDLDETSSNLKDVLSIILEVKGIGDYVITEEDLMQLELYFKQLTNISVS